MNLPSILLFTSILGSFFKLGAASDYTNFVYKGCADKKFQDPTGIYSQNLKSLFDSLVSQSSSKPFFTTTSGEGQNAIMGLYQCRGDLSTSQCYDCVGKMPDMAAKRCGNTIAARIQLSGCYLRYEIVGFKQVSETEFMYKVCGSSKASGAGFEERRNEALDMVVNGVKNGSGDSGKGLFYTGSYQSVYVLGQCEGDLGSSDCEDCVKSGVQRAESDCVDSISGQVYLHKCYISYSYYPNGVHSISSSAGTRQPHTQKTVAIVMGGIAGLGFIIVCLMFAKSLIKKKSEKHGGWN